MALQNVSKMWFFTQMMLRLELPILLKVISMCFHSFQSWKKIQINSFSEDHDILYFIIYIHILKKNLQNLQNLSTILSTVHMCLLLHELTASTSPPHLKHYSLNIKFLWTSFEKHSWSYFFFYYLELELALFFLYF